MAGTLTFLHEIPSSSPAVQWQTVGRPSAIWACTAVFYPSLLFWPKNIVYLLITRNQSIFKCIFILNSYWSFDIVCLYSYRILLLLWLWKSLLDCLPSWNLAVRDYPNFLHFAYLNPPVATYMYVRSANKCDENDRLTFLNNPWLKNIFT